MFAADRKSGERLPAPAAETTTMAKAAQKITLSRSRDIPFDKLVLSQSNVRKIKADISIEELAEDIARRGLLQSLNVRPVLDDDGQETGMFDVPAGGRRYQALALLVRQKRLAKTAPVPCVMREGASDILAEDDSLAENTQRAALHPLDQFRAFQTLREKGQSEEAIAAAFFVPVTVVKQRLKLASVAPELLEIYATDGMKLEQLMAFTVSSDHERQVQVWNAVKDSWQNEPYQIRRKLTETSIRCNDRRMRFVGIEAYEAAGGHRTRDLFEDDNGGWIDDVALLERLVAEKLKSAADAVSAEGWKWVSADISFSYGHTQGLRWLPRKCAELTEEEYAAREALRNEFEELEAEYDEYDEYPDHVEARLREIDSLLDAYENPPEVFDPEDVARAGAFVSIAQDGSIEVVRGYVRPEDEPGQEAHIAASPQGDATGGAQGDEAASGEPEVTVGTPAAESEEDDGDVIKPLPERLLTELTAWRTLALRDAVASNPQVAITALIHRLVIDTFGSGMNSGRCLEAFVREIHFTAQSEDMPNSPVAGSIGERHQAWASDLPLEDDEALWDWIANLDGASRMALLAHCVSFGINALHEKPNPFSGYGVSAQGLERRFAEADRLARATGLDMIEAGWRPTVDNYLGRVTKPRILEAVREGVGEDRARLLEHLKKGDMAREAERLLADSGWLPEPLRLAIDGEDPAAQPADLPAFLIEDADDSADGTETGADVPAIAAE